MGEDIINEKPKLKPMCRLTKEQIDQKKMFIDNYIQSSNASTGSLMDANANVAVKTVATLGAEVYKDMCIQINRSTMKDYITKYFDKETADEYIDLLEEHTLYKHDETCFAPGVPYCVAISMYPFLEHGMTTLGGESKAPKHLESFCGSFINLCFAVSSQFAGAVATVEWLMYFDHFARKDYGEDYLNTHKDSIIAKFQHTVYSLNQPAAARGYQSIFWNISVFDKYYFDAIFGNFYFPDGSQPNYESLRKLQYFFMEWFTEERTKSLLTFPVLTESSLNNEDGTPKDLEFAEKMAEFRANGLSFFSYNDTNASALSSCCRLRNSIENDDEDNEFAYTLGGVGVATGSTSVMTLNFNRVAQKAIRRYLKNQDPEKPLTKGYIHSFINNNYVQAEALFFNKVEELVKKIHKYQFAHRQIVEDYIKAGMLPAYTAGYITTNKQFCTIGISGLNECAEFMGYKVANNSDYKDFIARLLGILTRLNKEARKIYKIKFNSEFIPGENLGIKNAKWDKKDNLEVPRDCYNSYFYLSESDTTSIPDKFQMHGDPIASHIDGGSALHLNLSQLPDKEFFLWLRNLAGKYGCNYWTTNVLETMCEDCGHNDFRTLDECPVCGSKHVSYASRIIGYLKKIDSYSEGRKIEASKRYYH